MNRHRPRFRLSDCFDDAIDVAFVAALVATLIAIILATSAKPARGQEIFWARSTPEATRHVWIHGRNLWVGSQATATGASAVLEQSQRQDGLAPATYALTFEFLHGANGQDQNRGLGYCQRFVVPAQVPAGNYVLRWRRNDGQQASAAVTIPAVHPCPTLVPSGEVCYLDAPMIVEAGSVVDLAGCTYLPSDKFPLNKSMVVVRSGATLQNGQLICPEGSAPDKVVWVDTGKGTILRALNIVNGDRGELGLFLRSQSGSTFHELNVRAWRCVDSNPGDELQDNNFLSCRFSSPFGNADGQIGRGMGTHRLLAVECFWGWIDRGPTLSSQGSPLSQAIWFQCEQRGTGVADGASEGLLIESKKLALAGAMFVGKSALVKLADPAHAYALKPGYVLCKKDGSQSWARIVSVEDTGVAPGIGYTVKLDRSMGLDLSPSLAPVLVGNAAAENSFVRCRFYDGKSGLWLWGCSIDNAVIACDFRNLEWGVLTLERDNPPADSGFSWGLDARYNRFTRVGEPMRTSNKNLDWLTRPGSVLQ